MPGYVFPVYRCETTCLGIFAPTLKVVGHRLVKDLPVAEPGWVHLAGDSSGCYPTKGGSDFPGSRVPRPAGCGPELVALRRGNALLRMCHHLPHDVFISVFIRKRRLSAFCVNYLLPI
tara:strand:- start:606 stop:959 length:354 start_codon:yes stop_codon:yes gene_type:complete